MTRVPYSSLVCFLPWKPSLGPGVSQGVKESVGVGTVRCVHHSAFASALVCFVECVLPAP